MQAGELRNKLELYEHGHGYNELGEDDDSPSLRGYVFAKIVPATGGETKFQGESYEGIVTHKIYIRSNVELSRDMFFKYHDAVYRIKTYQPVYKNDRYMEVLTEMELV